MATVAELQRQLARAKMHFVNLCLAVEWTDQILIGRQRGSKDVWRRTEKCMHSGKSFFDGVDGVGDLAQACTKKSEDDNEND